MIHHRNQAISDWTQDWDTLLHTGNLKWLYVQGDRYRSTGDLSVLSDLKTRFQCSSLEMARVLFEYLEYMASDFAVSETRGGTKEMLGVAALGSQGLYKYFVGIKDSLGSNLTDAFLLHNLDRLRVSLPSFVPLSQSLFYQDFSPSFNHSSLPFFRRLCLLGPYNPFYLSFAKKYAIPSQMDAMCDPANPDSLAFLETIARSDINKVFNCSSTREYCTDKEIAILEMTSRGIVSSLEAKIASHLEWSDPYGHLGVDLRSFAEKYGEWESLNQSALYSWGKKVFNFEKVFMVLEV